MVLLGLVQVGWAQNASDPPKEKWASVVSLEGSRKLPVLGTVTYETHSTMISEVYRQGDSLHFSASTCGVSFPKSTGVKVRMSEFGQRQIPLILFTFTPLSGGGYTAAPWKTGWDAVDIDQDGIQGMTIFVDAPICGGELYISNEALSTASDIKVVEDKITLDLSAWTVQKVLGAKGWCLSLFSKSTEETLKGSAIYQKVPLDVDCDSADFDSMFKELIPAHD